MIYISLVIRDTEHLICLWSAHVSFVKYYFDCVHFLKNWVVYFVVELYKFGYIWIINSRSDRWFANTVSHSTGCLYVLVMVSFGTYYVVPAFKSTVLKETLSSRHISSPNFGNKGQHNLSKKIIKACYWNIQTHTVYAHSIFSIITNHSVAHGTLYGKRELELNNFFFFLH